MTLEEAKREFTIRICSWLHAELASEINNSFPNLRLFKSGYGWQLHHFMQSLGRDDQMALANAMAKQNPTYLISSGQMVSQKEAELWSAFRKFFGGPPALHEEIQSRRQVGEKVRLASKSKLRKASVTKFVEAFGSRCFDMNLDPEWDPLFHMKIGGWVVSTQLTFGRNKPVLSYRHRIVSETRIAHPNDPEITGPAMTLSPGEAWLANQWEDVFEEDVPAVSDALIRHSDFFFKAAPRLLAGLEFDKIVP